MKFHSGEIAVQERAGVRDIAEDVGEGIVDHLPPGASQFLALRQMAVLGTVDTQGGVWASVVTGDPGFIETVDESTLKNRGADIVERSDPRQSRGRRPRGPVRAGLRRLPPGSSQRPRHDQGRRNLSHDL